MANRVAICSMLQWTAPATKCHTGTAPATQRHSATSHSLHQPPKATLQHYHILLLHGGNVIRFKKKTNYARNESACRMANRVAICSMLQWTAPATKCHTGTAPATQRHSATSHSLHQPPKATLQRYHIVQEHGGNVLRSKKTNYARNESACRMANRVAICSMLQWTAPATKCHTGTAPATQRHSATSHSLHQPPKATLQRYHILRGNVIRSKKTNYARNESACRMANRVAICSMLQWTAPATKCNTGTAPATQRHSATSHSLHQPPKATLQHYHILLLHGGNVIRSKKNELRKE